MVRIFTNGPRKDYVINPFQELAGGASQIYLAAPYFTKPEPILDAVKKGAQVRLLIGLNESTTPQALAQVNGKPGIAVRYFTGRFHAKIFIFDDVAILGSSNLTEGGLFANREASIRLDQDNDREVVEEMMALFVELWEAGKVLTPQIPSDFTAAHKRLQQGPNPEAEIEKAVGKAVPPNIQVDSHKASKEQIFLEGLRRQIYQEYRPAFTEVTHVLEAAGYRRKELAELGPASETNRFLNWVRLTYAISDHAWNTSPLRSEAERRPILEKLGSEWVSTDDDKVTEDFAIRLEHLHKVFASAEDIRSASKEDLSVGLMALHAFNEQLRFVKGGEKNLIPEFWARNINDVERVRQTLAFLIYGGGEFIERLHDVLHSPYRKLSNFGLFCALELYGSLKPEECPPLNGRIAKALRYVGFGVRG